MRILAYTWAGVRTADPKSTARFFADTLGLSLVHESQALVQFEMPSGQLFELFGPQSRYYQLHACPVLAFQVEDVRATKKELERTDFAAFQPLADLPMAMTAHVVFTALDPVHPATTSATIIEQVIRGVIGFQGLLMSDDVSMNALSGSIAERTRAIFSAGCDLVLHCNGKLDEMREVAAETPELSGIALDRARRALASRRPPQPFDRSAARLELEALMSKARTAGA